MRAVLLCAATASLLAACQKRAPKSPPPPEAAPAPAPAPKNLFPDDTTLLFAQARFAYELDEAGEKKPVPQPAHLLMLRRGEDGFTSTRLEDPDSRVFHKAACVDFGRGPRLFTIGATEALAKLWRYENGAWQASELWRAKFGGKWDRLRDFELGDVTGDGEQDLVIGTHDQGVVVVLSRFDEPPAPPWQRVADVEGELWYVLELDRRPSTFVHEIELGDIDGDGALEIFATPSTPNKANAAQSGEIVMYRRVAKGRFAATTVARFATGHVKEILAADLDGDGKAEIYAAVEPARAPGGSLAVEVRRYERAGKSWRETIVASIEGAVQARVLLAADLCGAGRKDLIITTMKAGIWRIVMLEHGKQRFKAVQLDAATGGFEHAAAAFDLDLDGKPELYVSADEQDEIRRYICADGDFVRATIASMGESDLTWSIERCSAGH